MVNTTFVPGCVADASLPLEKRVFKVPVSSDTLDVIKAVTEHIKVMCKSVGVEAGPISVKGGAVLQWLTGIPTSDIDFSIASTDFTDEQRAHLTQGIQAVQQFANGAVCFETQPAWKVSVTDYIENNIERARYFMLRMKVTLPQGVVHMVDISDVTNFFPDFDINQVKFSFTETDPDGLITLTPQQMRAIANYTKSAPQRFRCLDGLLQMRKHQYSIARNRLRLAFVRAIKAKTKFPTDTVCEPGTICALCKGHGLSEGPVSTAMNSNFIKFATTQKGEQHVCFNCIMRMLDRTQDPTTAFQTRSLGVMHLMPEQGGGTLLRDLDWTLIQSNTCMEFPLIKNPPAKTPMAKKERPVMDPAITVTAVRKYFGDVPKITKAPTGGGVAAGRRLDADYDGW
jgi:hypothetical protein